jgi:malonyl-CoA O-methyltransferase
MHDSATRSWRRVRRSGADMDLLTVTYARPEDLFRDLRATGQRNAHGRRRRTLGGRTRWERMRAAYAAVARDGRVPATFEIVYGHAWKAASRKLADGRAIIRADCAPRAENPIDSGPLRCRSACWSGAV